MDMDLVIILIPNQFILPSFQSS